MSIIAPGHISQPTRQWRLWVWFSTTGFWHLWTVSTHQTTRTSQHAIAHWRRHHDIRRFTARTFQRCDYHELTTNLNSIQPTLTRMHHQSRGYNECTVNYEENTVNANNWFSTFLYALLFVRQWVKVCDILVRMFVFTMLKSVFIFLILQVDLAPGLSIDSFIHPSSCHIVALDLTKTACLAGPSINTIEADVTRRRVWTGALSRLLRRSDVHNLSPILKSRIAGFIEDQLIWIGTGVTDNLEQLAAAPWSDVFQILNVDNRYEPYLLNTINEQTELTTVRLFITTASRTLRDPAVQMKIIETSIHRALDLGHGFSLLHGTLCSLPIYFR